MAVEPASVSRVSARPAPLIRVVDCYYSRNEVPAPPADKPWLRPGGVYELDAERELRVKFQSVERKTRSGETVRFFILAFHATRMNMSKVFASSMRSQRERERDALAWLQSDASLAKGEDRVKEKEKARQSDEELSESESTFAQDTRFRRRMQQVQ